MGCRCRDISDCEDDIRTLNKCIEYTKELTNIDSNVEDSLNALSALYKSTFTVTNISDLITKNNNLNDRLNALFKQMDRRILNEIEELKIKLKSMKREDKDYHERERKRHKHDD